MLASMDKLAAYGSKHTVNALLIIAVILLSTFAVFPSVHAVTTKFDNIVIIAMENRDLTEVFNNANAPFITSMLGGGWYSTNYPSYGASGRSMTGCSAGCYTALISGSSQGISDGYPCCIAATTVIDSMVAAGKSWQAFCEAGCARGNDHFPFTGFTSLHTSGNIHAGSTVSISDFVSAANAATPSNLLWYTPTDANNMHDGTVAAGDAYIKNFFVGSGTLQSPASGSLLASSLFNAGRKTLLMLWWDECDKSLHSGTCPTSGVSAPVLMYGSIVNKGKVSTSTYDHYSVLRMIEDNWGLVTLTSNDAAATGLAADIFSSPPPPDFTISASPPSVSVPLNAQGTSTITIGAVSGFTGTVTFTGSNPGLSCTINPSVITASGTSTLSCSSSASGVWTANVTGTSGSLVHSVTVTFNVATVGTFYTNGSCSPSGNSGTAWCLHAVSPSTATIDSNGILRTTLVNTGSSYSGSYYAVGIYGCAPYCEPNLTPALNVSSLSFKGTFVSNSTSSSSNSFRLETSLYFKFATPQSGTTCGSHVSAGWLDTEIQFSNFDNNVYNPTGSYIGCGGSNTITYRETVRVVKSGQPFSLQNFNITAFYLRALALQGLPSTTAARLYGIEPGIEGYGFNSIVITYQSIVANDFRISASPSSVSVPLNTQGNSTITVSSANGFAGTVNLSVSAPGLSCNLNPSSVTLPPNRISTLTCHGFSVGNYLATVTATSGALSHSANVTYHITTISYVAGPTCGENDPQGTTTSTGSYTSTSGDIIIAVAGTMHGPMTFTSSMVTDTIGNTYSLRTSNNDVGIWTATAKSTGTNSIKFTNSGSSTYYAICAGEYSGASVGTNVNTSSGSGTSLTVAVSGAASTSWVVGGFISWDTTSISMSSPSVQRQFRANFNLNINEGDVPASSSTTLTASLSASQSWYGAAVELKPGS